MIERLCSVGSWWFCFRGASLVSSMLVVSLVFLVGGGFIGCGLSVGGMVVDSEILAKSFSI